MLGLGAVAIIALASFRATRLVVTDSILAGPREWLYLWAWDPEHPVDFNGTAAASPRKEGRGGALRTWVYDLLTCPWCLGVWMSAASYAAWRWGHDVGRSLVVVAAVAGLQGALAALVSKTEG